MNNEDQFGSEIVIKRVHDHTAGGVGDLVAIAGDQIGGIASDSVTLRVTDTGVRRVFL